MWKRHSIIINENTNRLVRKIVQDLWCKKFMKSQCYEIEDKKSICPWFKGSKWYYNFENYIFEISLF